MQARSFRMQGLAEVGRDGREIPHLEARNETWVTPQRGMPTLPSFRVPRWLVLLGERIVTEDPGGVKTD